MPLSTTSEIGLLLLIVGVIALVVVAGYYIVRNMTPPPPSPPPSPPSPSGGSSHHSSSATLSPIYGGIGTPTTPKSVENAHILSIITYPLSKFAWAASTGSSPDTVSISTSPNDFNLSPKSGTICKKTNTKWCIGVDTSGSPSSGDELTLADTTQLSDARLRNFVWDTASVPWPSGWSPESPDSDKAQSLMFCLTDKNGLCATIQMDSENSPPRVVLTNVDEPTPTAQWAVIKNT